jgi:hypothetical protein
LVGLAFIALNAIWFSRRAIGVVDAPMAGPWTPEQTAEHLDRAARLLKITGIATFAGWLVLAMFLEWIGITFLWAAASGTIICLGARALAKHRDPGTVPLILAMAPVSPAVVLGLPVGLQMLRTLARPEVQSFFEAKAREKEAEEMIE